MSAAGPEVDLDVLARERAAPTDVRRPRRWLRVVVPLALLLAFLAVLGSSLGDLLRGAREVSLVRPVPVAAGAGRQAPGQVVAQAAGWVEPDPFPVRVTALAEGVVREMLVQESDVVEAGAPVALLIEDDARIALELAGGMLDRARGELAQAQAELRAAREAFEAAIEVTAARARAEADLAGRRSEAEARAQAVAKGHALLAVASDELVVQRELEAAGASGPRQVELASARVDEARGELAGLEAEAALASAAVEVARAELERARRDLELRTEERLRVESAEAAVARAEGMVAETRATCEEARLRLERMVVRAPVRGVVLERLATVGSELGGEMRAVATLYDPSSIRVRVDVPQQDLAGLFVGQAARIESDARPGRPYAGKVIRVVRKADVQKVTMQAHVRVLDGDDLLRPEMLMQVRFLAPEAEGAPPREAAGQAVAVPARLVREDGQVWVLDVERGSAALRRVRVGARDGDLVVVEQGLDLSDKLIDAGGAPLSEGERVRAREQLR